VIVLMKVLFVCTGNTCRSCMAEAIFNTFSNTDNMIAYSAGISVIPGSMTSFNSAQVVKKHLDLDISKRKAIQLTEDIMKSVDLIFTMTKYIKNTLTHTFPEFEYKIFTLKGFVSHKDEDVVDPFGGNITDYEFTYKDLKNSIFTLLNKLKEDIGIV
jgi:protein-tyrosine phosphatase